MLSLARQAASREIGSEGFSRRIEGVGYAIGVEKQAIAGVQKPMVHRVLHGLIDA